MLLEAVPINSLAVGIFAKTSPLALNPKGGQIALGEGETDTFLRTVFLTGFFFTTGFFTTAFLVAVAFVVAFAVALTEGVGEGFFVAACTGAMPNESAIPSAIKRLIAIPLKFTNSEKRSKD